MSRKFAVVYEDENSAISFGEDGITVSGKGKDTTVEISWDEIDLAKRLVKKEVKRLNEEMEKLKVPSPQEGEKCPPEKT